MSCFRIEDGTNGIVHLVMDDPARRVNVIDAAALEGLEAALTELERRPGLAGVVLRSGKPGSFIAGADIQAIASITARDRAEHIIARAHTAFGRLAALPVPTVAAIDGVCLGGGTELALACQSRVASEEPHTQIGLPEVLLGIIPGFGGTSRLPRLVGLSNALDLILTGRALDARRAEKMGLVKRAVPAAWLVDHAERRIRELAAKPAPARADRYRPRGFGAWFIDSTPFGHSIAFSQARAMTRARTGGHYPAPLAAIRVLEHGIGRPLAQALALEVNEVPDLLVGPVCKNLVRVFLLSEAAKKSPVVPGNTSEPAAVSRMILVGAGVMGGGIAELASRTGVEVRVRDVNAGSLQRALQTARGLIDDRLRRRRMPSAARERERDGQLARIQPTLELTGLGRADFVIEAVVEDLDIKRRVFAEIEVRVPPAAVIATNTSSLSVNTLAEGLERPDRFCGFHFFNPVHRMPLVEVVRGRQTSDETMITAVGLARRLGKTPVVVNDAPGFIVNRILMPYLREAMVLLDEGFALKDIDASMRRFGMPMGPFEVIDEVGLDVAGKVAGILSKAFPDRMQPAPALDKLIAAGRLGRKSGAGFYRHAPRRRLDPEVTRLLGITRKRSGPVADTLIERMTLAMVNEASRCLEDGVAADAGAIDLAMIFGAGFPPFRGGPLRYADSLGLGRVASRLTALQADKGPRYTPSARLVELANAGGTFTQP